MLPAAQPVAIAATSDIPQADAPIAAAKADRMVIASLIQKLRLKLFLFIVVLFIRQRSASRRVTLSCSFALRKRPVGSIT